MVKRVLKIIENSIFMVKRVYGIQIIKKNKNHKLFLIIYFSLEHKDR